ncbi:MAG: [Fe-Fe] hydrogenase large subunit C-terminal domain-containing protein [Bacteroidales bacterium]
MKIPLIEIKKEKCNICYACVRVCPVNAIQVKHNQDHPEINIDWCIGCGACINVCSPKAVVYRDSREEVKKILSSADKVAAIVGPSISGEFDDITDYRKFVQMIRHLGFDFVNEVSFGVDLIAKEYGKLFENYKGKYYISSICPPIVSLIEKFHPELVENLAPITSPMIATAHVVRKIYGNDIKVVFIGPCIAAKNDINKNKEWSQVDEVLTFVELRQLFEEFNIKENALEFSDFDAPLGYKGSLFPISNGILQAADLDENLLSGNIITAEGKSNILAAIDQFDKSIDFIKQHFNLFYCEGCLMGPGTSRGGKKFIRRTLVKDYANKRLMDFNKKDWEDSIKIFDEFDYRRGFSPNDQRLPEPTEEEIQEVLKVIGKTETSDNIGCEACGYKSCKDFAHSVSKGLAKPDMCITFSLKNKQEYIKALKLSNEKLAKIQETLKNTEKISKIETQKAIEASETITTMMQKLNAGVLIVDANLKIIQSNESFINILGTEAREINEIIPGLIGADLKTLLPVPFYKMFSYVLINNEDVLNRDVHFGEGLLNVSIFTIRKEKIVGAIIRDMFSPEVRSEEVINRVNDVIDVNLSMVQQIGFLLGEGAANTEKMLNSIIEYYKTKKK